jgi:large subunit ribosomal protein L21
MYAVFSMSGQQVKGTPGEQVRVDFMGEAKEGEKVTFDEVLLVSDGAKVRIGTPFVGAKVVATVMGHGRERKIIVFKKKRRVDYHKKHGHRQDYTTLKIEAIEG